MSRRALPPFPTGDLRSWAQQVFEYLTNRDTSESENLPEPIQLAYQIPPTVHRATVDGILMFDAIRQVPVYSQGGVWKDLVSSGGGGGSSVTIGDTFPLSPTVGDLHYKTSATVGLYVYYDDGDSQQWVQTNTGGINTLAPLNQDLRLDFDESLPENRFLDFYDTASGYILGRLGYYTSTPDGSIEIAKYSEADGSYQNYMTMYDSMTYFGSGVQVSGNSGVSAYAMRHAEGVGSYLWSPFINENGWWDWSWRYENGGDLQLNRYDGAGNYQDTPIRVNYADGTVDIQTKEYHDPAGLASWRIVGNTLEVWGNHQVTQGSGSQTFNFPKTFAAPPTVTATSGSNAAGGSDNYTITVAQAAITASQFSVSVRQGNTSATNVSFQYHAVGEWDGVS